MRYSSLTYVLLIAAATLEVAGDAVIRKGLRGGGVLLIAAGFFMLGSYGVVVNLGSWDFSRLLGVYVAVFATIAVLFGRFLFRDAVPLTTWVGLATIIGGAAVIQFGPALTK